MSVVENMFMDIFELKFITLHLTKKCKKVTCIEKHVG